VAAGASCDWSANCRNDQAATARVLFKLTNRSLVSFTIRVKGTHTKTFFRRSPSHSLDTISVSLRQSGLFARRRNISRYHTGYALHIHIVYRNASRPFLTLHRVAGTRHLQYMEICCPLPPIPTFSTRSNMPNSFRSGFAWQPEYKVESG